MNTSNQLTLSGFDSGDCGTSTTALAVNSPSLPPQLPQSAPDFVFITPNETEQLRSYLSWRILLQVVGMQLQDYDQAHSDKEREEWKQRIFDTLLWINLLAQTFSPQSIPSDIVPPTEAYRVLNVNGVNWCVELMKELTCLFLNVPIADTSRIELQDAALLSTDNAASSHNLSALLKADDISILQEPTR